MRAVFYLFAVLLCLLLSRRGVDVLSTGSGILSGSRRYGKPEVKQKGYATKPTKVARQQVGQECTQDLHQEGQGCGCSCRSRC
jgi:hypothetical protein